MRTWGVGGEKETRDPPTFTCAPFPALAHARALLPLLPFGLYFILLLHHRIATVGEDMRHLCIPPHNACLLLVGLCLASCVSSCARVPLSLALCSRVLPGVGQPTHSQARTRNPAPAPSRAAEVGDLQRDWLS